MGRQSRARLEQRRKGGPGQPRGWFMRRRSRWVAAGIAVLVLAAGGVGAWQWNAARAAPEPAPRFNLRGSSGKTYTLDDFRGKQEVVLIFYMGAG
ncbi:MAG: hypothetical protein HY727_10005 [Candidatus Rokubacteria bacterium]|nr:hypothetical protein [Candidatus Rokubacteria bacterium]